MLYFLTQKQKGFISFKINKIILYNKGKNKKQLYNLKHKTKKFYIFQHKDKKIYIL